MALLISAMIAMTVPSMVSSQEELRIDAAVQRLRIDLVQARSAAIKRNESVTVLRTGPYSYSVAGDGARELEGNVTFGSLSATSITFTSAGTLAPTGPRTMVLRLGSQTRIVAVSSAGFSRVRPQE